MFIKRIKIFNLLGFPIYLDLSWFIIVVLITWSLAATTFPHFYKDLPVSTYWLMGLAGAIGLFVSILAHELGHSVVARQFDVPINGITLFIFGGVAEMSKEPPSAKAEFLVAVAGPLVSLVIAIVGLAVGLLSGAYLPTPVIGVIWYLGVINGVLVLFNMIPAFPLDGGRVLRSILWQIKGSMRWATKITSTIGAGFGLFLIVLGVISFIGGDFIGGMWQFLIGMFLRNAAQMSYQHVLVRQAIEGEPVARFMRSDVVTVPPTITISQLVNDYVYKHHHKMFPVTENGHPMGLVTTRMIQKIPQSEWSTRQIGDFFEPADEENTIDPEADAMKALSCMSRNGASRLMVVRDGQLVGILSLKDLLKFISLKVELEDGNGMFSDQSLIREGDAGQRD